ncbi:MAG TPA: preprotein translocase subunit YajC [Clostridiales bacterium]|jgi:preprotein translocase subunit YajC|nr:preprotein translocase subunit YajC [Clostridiales bacterium]HBE12751.1 preprotein translocase subunit YajC [Clostridiales bacterium]
MDSYGSIIIIVLMFVVLYFVMIRPQKKQEKAITAMRDNLQLGDEVSTNGGILGRIVKIKDDIVTLELGSDKNKIKVFKWAIRAVEVPANTEEISR